VLGVRGRGEVCDLRVVGAVAAQRALDGAQRVVEHLVPGELEPDERGVVLHRGRELAAAVHAEVVPAQVDALELAVLREQSGERGAARGPDVVVPEVHLDQRLVPRNCLAERLEAAVDHADAVPLQPEEGQRRVVRNEPCEGYSALATDIATTQVQRPHTGILFKLITEHATSLVSHECVGERDAFCPAFNQPPQLLLEI